MKIAYSKEEIELLANQFASTFKLRDKPFANTLATGVAEADKLCGGLPRGAISEILGPPSSGRTTLLHSVLSVSTRSQEVCALVDVSDSFDATSAAGAGVILDQLLWIRCGGSIDHGIKATDLLVQSGGFGLVALDLGDIDRRDASRIQLSWWFRFRRAIESTPTALLVISRNSNARSSASLVLELTKESEVWSHEDRAADPSCSNLLEGLTLKVERRKPESIEKREARFEARSSR